MRPQSSLDRYLSAEFKQAEGMFAEHRGTFPIGKEVFGSMKTTSFLSNAIEGYVKYRKASGRDSYSYIKNVILVRPFLREGISRSKSNYTQEIVDRWCRQRPTECTNSCVSRVYPVSDFIKYMNKAWNDEN